MYKAYKVGGSGMKRHIYICEDKSCVGLGADQRVWSNSSVCSPSLVVFAVLMVRSSSLINQGSSELGMGRTMFVGSRARPWP